MALSGGTDDSDRSVTSQLNEHLLKVLVVGDFGVGKTSVIRRYTEGTFSREYKLTLGVDFALKTVDFNTNTRINLQLWDIAGHERFGQMTQIYYKYAIAAMIVFDVTRSATYDAVTRWLDDIKSKVTLPDGRPVPIILLANKCDVNTSSNTNLDTHRLNDYCHQNDIISWFPSSAKDNVNIDESFDYLIGHILATKGEVLEFSNGHKNSCIRLQETRESDDTQPTCCCCLVT